MRTAILILAIMGSLGGAVFAADSASLQFTVPAPDPAMAGEDVVIQALAVNSGTRKWDKGSFYWVAEIYDMEYNFVTKTEEFFSQEEVAPGAVAAAALKFHIPETFTGRRFYRIFLVKDGVQIIISDYRAFQITEKKLQAPELEKYKMGGDVTITYKNSNRGNWKGHSGTTNANIIGKVGESSFLFNTYLLHNSQKLVDPYIILLNYYAPWGIMSLGDISPAVSPLSVYGQGMRGGLLEQQKDRFFWTVFGGRSVTALPGTLTMNGRYERQMYGVKAGINILPSLKLYSNYVIGSDVISSLSFNPAGEKYAGPTLTPQKNPVYGIGLNWEPSSKFSFLADYQNSEYVRDTTSNQPGEKDSAWRAEGRWNTELLKLKTAAQYTGPKFMAFGSPSAVTDRMTYEGSLGLYPIRWMALSAALNRYSDNLKNDPSKVTTTQTLMTFGNSVTASFGTVFNFLYSANTAVGKPRVAQDNRTTTMNFGISQPLGSQSLGFGYQISRFTDNNKLAHDLDSTMFSLSAVLKPFSQFSCSLSAVTSSAKDIVDSSANKNNSYSASAAYVMPARRLAVQMWATNSANKNDSLVARSDSSTLSVNSEVTWIRNAQSSIALGVGRRSTEDKIDSARSSCEISALVRYRYSF
ncbi:MAG: hypothetical protein ABIG11_09510 [bacterium]